MSILMMIIVGGLIGWAGARVMGREEGVFGSIVIGIIGAFIGTALANLLGSGSESYTSLTWSGVLWSFIGAIVLAALLNAFQSRRHYGNRV